MVGGLEALLYIALSSMFTVMQIRPVDMRMGDRLMGMEMFMWFGNFLLGVVMAMMFVMDVLVLMSNGFMGV